MSNRSPECDRGRRRVRAGSARQFLLRVLDQPHRPEIAGEIPLHQILVRHREIAALSPAGPPGITDREALLTVVITYCQHRVAAEKLLALGWHRHDTSSRNVLALEAFVHAEAKDEWVATREAALHLGQVA